MKNIYKILTLVLVLVAFSCEEDGGSRFSDDPSKGWVQFLSDSSSDIVLDAYDFSVMFEVPIKTAVPYNMEDLNITYSLQSVSGQDPNQVFSNGNSIVVPANNGGTANVGGYPFIQFDIAEAQNITEVMVFDVVLESTNRSSVSVGIDGSTRPTSHRVTICPSLDVSTGSFIGDYVLTVTTDVGPFGQQFENGITVTLAEGNNGPFSRVFQADYLPGIGAGLPVVDVEFLLVDDEGSILIYDGISTGVGCSGEILLGGDADNQLSSPCGDEEIMLNMIDFQAGSGACGVGDVPMTIMLTKV